jgi:hypothetical protein
MVCALEEEATVLNIPSVIRSTIGVGVEIERHVVDLLSSNLISFFLNKRNLK